MSVSERPLPVHAPMNQFAVAAGQLLVGGIPLERLAARVGQTPFYAYDRTVVEFSRCRVARGAAKEHQAALCDESQPDAGTGMCHGRHLSMASTSLQGAS